MHRQLFWSNIRSYRRWRHLHCHWLVSVSGLMRFACACDGAHAVCMSMLDRKELECDLSSTILEEFIHCSWRPLVLPLLLQNLPPKSLSRRSSTGNDKIHIPQPRFWTFQSSGNLSNLWDSAWVRYHQAEFAEVQKLPQCQRAHCYWTSSKDTRDRYLS